MHGAAWPAATRCSFPHAARRMELRRPLMAVAACNRRQGPALARAVAALARSSVAWSAAHRQRWRLWRLHCCCTGGGAAARRRGNSRSLLQKRCDISVICDAVWHARAAFPFFASPGGVAACPAAGACPVPGPLFPRPMLLEPPEPACALPCPALRCLQTAEKSSEDRSSPFVSRLPGTPLPPSPGRQPRRASDDEQAEALMLSPFAAAPAGVDLEAALGAAAGEQQAQQAGHYTTCSTQSSDAFLLGLVHGNGAGAVVKDAHAPGEAGTAWPAQAPGRPAQTPLRHARDRRGAAQPSSGAAASQASCWWGVHPTASAPCRPCSRHKCRRCR